MQVSSSFSMQSVMARAQVTTIEVGTKAEEAQVQPAVSKGRGHHYTDRVERTINRFDSNGDGGLSYDEVKNSKLGRRVSEERFAKIDGDGNGQVTADEALSYLNERRGRGLGGLMGRRAHGHHGHMHKADHAQTEGASADSISQLASSQAVTSVTTTKIEATFIAVSVDAFSFSSGGSFAKPAVEGDQMVAPAPTEMTPAEEMVTKPPVPEGTVDVPAAPVLDEAGATEEKPSAAMVELEKIEAEAAAEEIAESEGFDSLDDLFAQVGFEDLAGFDPLKILAELAEMMGFDLGLSEEQDPTEEALAKVGQSSAPAPEQVEAPVIEAAEVPQPTPAGAAVEADAEEGATPVGSLSSDISANASFGAGDFSFAAFKFEATQTTTTLADGSSSTKLSVNFVAISAYSRTMELTSAA